MKHEKSSVVVVAEHGEAQEKRYMFTASSLEEAKTKVENLEGNSRWPESFEAVAYPLAGGAVMLLGDEWFATGESSTPEEARALVQA